MKLLERRKIQKNINGIIEANQLFTDFLDLMKENYRFNDNDEININMLQEHLTNMTVIFVGMSDNVKNK